MEPLRGWVENSAVTIENWCEMDGGNDASREVLMAEKHGERPSWSWWDRLTQYEERKPHTGGGKTSTKGGVRASIEGGGEASIEDGLKRRHSQGKNPSREN